MSLEDQIRKKFGKEKAQSKPIVEPEISPLEESKLPSKRKKITGDKTLDKNQMIEWFLELFKQSGNKFTLDYLRGQKQNFESVFEMRK